MVSLVHTDISRINLKILRDSKYGEKPQARAINYLIQNHDHEEIWFPAYNYDFGITKIFNPEIDGTNVGAINSIALKMPNSIRTFTPMYSYVGFGTSLQPEIKDVYRPFGSGSELQTLLNLDADILFYGANINSFTFIHYIEEQNQIEYRYTKMLKGALQVNKKLHSISIELKVRPFGKFFNYDWGKIENDLRSNKVIRSIKNIESENIAFKLSESLEFITKQLELDPYYLLDQQTKEWVIPLLRDKKRPFLIEDFEV